MLHIGVDDCDKRRGARQHPLDTGGCEAPAADAMHATHAPIFLCALAQQMFRAVERIVYNENDFPVEAAQRPLKRCGQWKDIFALGVRGDDNSKLWHGLANQAATGHWKPLGAFFPGAGGSSPCPGESIALMR